jgi:hypothetical protein
VSEICEHETFKDICGTCHRDAQITRLTAEVERLKKEIIGRQAHDRMQVREIKHLTAEVEQNATDLEEYRRDVERLRAGLRECEVELNVYYRMEYPGDHPYSQKKLAQAMASNPATVALSGDKQ